MLKGIMKQAIVMSIPVRAFKATAPPNTSIAITIELASKAKSKNTLWPNFPNLRYRNSVKYEKREIVFSTQGQSQQKE